MAWELIGTELSAGEVSLPEIQPRECSELPDDSGEKKYSAELPDDSGELMESKIQKQEETIEKVRRGETTLTDTQEKGNYGAMVATSRMRQLGYSRISKDAVTGLKDSTHQGIDGVYHNLGGYPPYIIADAKYNTAQLEQTLDGKQMSESWIDSRLDAAVGKERADDIREAMLDDDVGCYVIRVGIGNDVNSPVIFEKLDGNADIVSRGERIDA